MGLVAGHHWWKQKMGLLLADPGVDEHLFSCYMLDHGTQYEQANLPDFALGEKLGTSTSGRVSAGHAPDWKGLDRRDVH